jgi:allantoinase
LWGGLVPGNLAKLEELRDRGVVGLKAFMCDSGIDDFSAVDVGMLRDGMRRAAELDLLVAVHAESSQLLRPRTDKTDVRSYLESRPVEAELEAIRTAAALAEETGCRLHVVHVSCGQGVAIVAEARARGVDVTCETCPHYLVLTDEDMVRLGAVAKCAPPLRSTEEQAGLWQQIGNVATIGSDHSPSPFSMKERENFFEIWGGISGCQHLLPLLLDTGALSRDEIIRLTSVGVARRFRMSEKGGIEIGKDADLTLVEEQETEEVSAASLHYRHAHTPYVGRKIRGKVARTILRGQTIFESGRFAAQPIGRFIRPTIG